MERKSTNELGIAGMVLGIIAVTLSCVLFGGIVGIIGLCISIGATRDKTKNSGSALSGIILNSVSIVLAIIAFMVLLFGFSNSEKKPTISLITNQQSSTKSENIPSLQLPDPVPEMPSVPVQEQEASSIEDCFELDACKTGNCIENSIWKVSFVDASEYDKVGDDIFPMSAKSGNKFLVLFFEIENISDEEHFFTSYNFDSYLDGYVLDQSLCLDDINGYKTISKNIAPGMKHKGYLLFEVPKDWKELIFTYDGLDSSAKMNFELLKTDL